MEPDFQQAASIPGAQAVEQGQTPGLSELQGDVARTGASVTAPAAVGSSGAGIQTQQPQPTSSATSGSNIITGIQKSVPGAKDMTPIQIAKELTDGITGQNPATFLNALKESLPSLKDVPNDVLGKSILSQLNDLANTGGLSSGNQSIDMGLEAPQQTTIIGKVAKFIGGITLEPLVNLLLNIGTDIAKPSVVKSYTDAVAINKQVIQNATDAIAKKQALGQDTSKLQAILQDELNNIPQPKDFFDQSTLKRINQTTGQNIEDIAGGVVQSAAGLAALIPGEGLVEGEAAKALDPAASIGSKFASGAKAGAAYGAAFGGGGAAAQGASAGDVAKGTVGGAVFGGITGSLLEGGVGIASKGLGATARGLANIGDAAVENIARTPEDADAVSSFIKERQTQAKDLAKNPLADSPTEVEAQSQYNEDVKESGNVYNGIKTLLTDAGTRIGQAVEAKAATPLDVTPIVDSSYKELARRDFTGDQKVAYKNLQSDLKAAMTKGEDIPEKVTYQGLKIQTDKTTGDKFVINQKGEVIPVPKDIAGGTAQGGTFKAIHNFLAEYKNTDFKTTFGNKAGSVLNSMIKQINDAAKETGGTEYTDALADYKQYSQSVNDLDDLKGKKNARTGKYTKAASIVGESTKTAGDNRELFKALDQQLGESVHVGGMSPSERNILSSFIEDLYNGKSVKASVGNLRVAMNPTMMIARTAIGLVDKGLKDPDVIIQKLLDTIEASKGMKI